LYADGADRAVGLRDSASADAIMVARLEDENDCECARKACSGKAALDQAAV